jgi:hypothetical protein
MVDPNNSGVQVRMIRVVFILGQDYDVAMGYGRVDIILFPADIIKVARCPSEWGLLWSTGAGSGVCVLITSLWVELSQVRVGPLALAMPGRGKRREICVFCRLSELSKRV